MTPEMIHVTEAFKILDLKGVSLAHGLQWRRLEKLGLRCVQGPKFGRGHLWFCYKQEVLALKKKMDEDAAKAKSAATLKPNWSAAEPARNFSVENLLKLLHEKIDAQDQKMDRLLELWSIPSPVGSPSAERMMVQPNTQPLPF